MRRRIRPEHLSRVGGDQLQTRRGSARERLRHLWHRVDPQNDWRLQLPDFVPTVST